MGERSTWSYDKKDGVEPWTVSTSNTTVPDQSPVSRSNVTTEEAKETHTIDVAAKRRLEKLKALFGDDSEDEDELFTPTGTPKTSAQKPPMPIRLTMRKYSPHTPMKPRHLLLR